MGKERVVNAPYMSVQTRFAHSLLDVGLAFYYLSEGDVLSHLGYLNSHPFAFLSIRDNNDEAPFNSRDAISLFPKVINFNLTSITFSNRWLLRLAFML